MNNWINELYRIPLWKMYSQSHEEAYLQFILNNIKSAGNVLVELGAWDGYHLSNTRYFINQGYEALLIDGDNHGNDEVKEHFITQENILPILNDYKCPEQFDLFCIDLDGNDLYILDKVLTEYEPNVIIAEFNPIFAPHESFAIAYNPEHQWNNDDYYGFSFRAGVNIGLKHGYRCIFQNDNLNMYFVKNDVLMESLKVGDEDMAQYLNLPEPAYTVTQYHPKSNRTDWWAI